jgi:hypothetical protein
MLGSLILAASLQFASPVHIPITLAGNFGEPRPNHFHGGIDIRTERQEGYPVFSIGDGYVYRLTVGNGYGNAIYVRHPNGKVSVYAHLKDFAPPLRAIISRWRKAHGQEDVIDQPHESSDFADIRLNAYEYPVAQGQLLATSGNTGSSQAPHLHLEIHDSKSWAVIDPLNFLSSFLKDTQSPTAQSFMAYPVAGQGVFEGNGTKCSFAFTDNHLSRTFKAWGRVGFGILANDHMEECYQKYGIRHTTLTVDGRVVFESNVDSIPWAMNRFVNSWGDYDYYYDKHEWYMKSFVEPGNPLPVIKADANRGIVNFSEERDYHLEYTLTDAFGNESRYSFVVHGERQPIPPPEAFSFSNLLRWERINSFQLPGLQLVVRPGSLASNMLLAPEVEYADDALSDIYTLRASSSPVVRHALLSIRLKQDVPDTSRLFLDCDGYNMGGTYADGWLTAAVYDLGGTFQIKQRD